MQKFTTHHGTVALLDRENVDTDQIIPKQFLKRTERTGYQDCLFFDWRFDADGRPNPAFPLNAPEYSGASILLAGRNFGCGSSREHAAWALRDFGFRAVLAESFADIFVENCTNNGIAAIAVEIDRMAKRPRLTLHLEQCEIRDDRGLVAKFEIDPFRRQRLLSGHDEIALTLRFESKIAEYERLRGCFTPKSRQG